MFEVKQTTAAATTTSRGVREGTRKTSALKSLSIGERKAGRNT